jgi:hypothetical protein
VHRLKMAACELAWRMLWRWWPHAYMATLPDGDPPTTVHAGGPRKPDMATINRSAFVMECVIRVGDIVQTGQSGSDEADDGTNSG